MPLDDFQARVLRILHPLRSNESVFAGGSVLHRHGFRLSDDQDLFHGAEADLISIARRDVDALRAAGFSVYVSTPYEGLVDAVVSVEMAGTTKVQWVESGSWNFFEAIPDPDLGYRLHMADLSVNKVLAAAGRRKVRDFVDLVLIHRHIMPLWHAIWAAPGKDASWSPLSLLERLSRANQFTQVELDEEVISTVALDASSIGSIVREALDEAREVFSSLDPETAGSIFHDGKGNLIDEIERIASGTDTVVTNVAMGGAWPSGPDIDRAMILRVVESFGWEGSTPPTTYP